MPDKQDIKLKEGSTLRADNGEWSDRVTLVTKEIRVHGKVKAAKSQDEEDEIVLYIIWKWKNREEHNKKKKKRENINLKSVFNQRKRKEAGRWKENRRSM